MSLEVFAGLQCQLLRTCSLIFFFFLNDTAPTETSPLPLHDALPIWQRVAVGRAIAPQPAVFLFDEPLSNLDAKLRVQTRAEITKLQATLGTTSVYVTHDQIEAKIGRAHV